jgi:hypothetical protein
VPLSQDDKAAFYGRKQTRKDIEMTKALFETKPITDASTQVPDGYCRFEDLTQDATEQKRLSDAHKAGKIPAVKLMRTLKDEKGPVWVQRDLAAEFLRGRQEQISDAAMQDAMDEAMQCSKSSVASFDAIEFMEVVRSLASRLETLCEHTSRIADAAEDRATAPQSLVGCSNGFHS